MDEQKPVQIFVASPRDVISERSLAERIIARLDREFRSYFRVESILWEHEPLLATHHPQDVRNIPAAHTTDIVVVIMWSRLGDVLDEDKFRGAISGRPVTGTEWEFEDALSAALVNDAPKLLVYFKTKEVNVLLSDPELESRHTQKRLVDDFKDRWFANPQHLPTIAAWHTFDTPENFEEKLYENLRQLLERRVGGLDITAPTRWREPPFRGLLSFEIEHAAVFFGRTRARNEVREMLALQEKLGRAFVLILGASGSGKSSLVKAGILPDLKLPGMIQYGILCRYAIMRPSDNSADVVGALASAILSDSALPELNALRYNAERVANTLRENSAQSSIAIEQGLAIAAKAEGLTMGEARLVLVIDQLEEIFTIATLDDDARSRFAAALNTLARSGLVWVIATMRSDFFDRLDSISVLSELAENSARYLLRRPTDGELEQMIREPAREAGLRFEVDRKDGTTLDEQIRAAARNSDSLPLLSFVLDELWKQRTERGLLTVDAYQRLGGLEGALARRAEDEFRALPDAVRAALPRILRALVTFGPKGELVSRTSPLSTFAIGSFERQLIEAFAAPGARLFVIAADQSGAGPKVQVAHEALLTHWDRARGYLRESLNDLQLEFRLQDAAYRWKTAVRKGRKSLLIQRGLPLAEATDLLDRRGGELPPEVRDFITLSASEARAGTTWRWSIVVVVMLVLAGLAFVSTSNWIIATRESNRALIAESRFLARDSQSAIEKGHAILGIQRALDALPRRIQTPDRPFVREAATALATAILSQRQRVTLRGHRGGVLFAAFSFDGTRVVTASDDKTAHLWDARTGGPIAMLSGHADVVYSAQFSRDGKRIVTASRDKTARVWDAKTRSSILVLSGRGRSVLSAAFSPDGRRVITTSNDGTAHLWTLSGSTSPMVLRGNRRAVWFAAFSPDGLRVVTAGDKTARVWDSQTGASLAVMRGHGDVVYSADFSHDGKRVVTASRDRTARIWDAKSGALIRLISGHEGAVTSAAFSPDGKRIVTASSDKTARLWDANTGMPIAVLRRHDGTVEFATFSPDGTRVVTASLDATARLWDVTGVSLRCQALIDQARTIVPAMRSRAESGREFWQKLAQVLPLTSFETVGDKCG